jgi:hypothetical protein
MRRDAAPSLDSARDVLTPVGGPEAGQDTLWRLT